MSEKNVGKDISFKVINFFLKILPVHCLCLPGVSPLKNEENKKKVMWDLAA